MMMGDGWQCEGLLIIDNQQWVTVGACWNVQGRGGEAVKRAMVWPLQFELALVHKMLSMVRGCYFWGFKKFKVC